MSDIYPSGAMDPFIRTALDRAEVVRDLYRRISKVERPAGWLPISVVCPTCGRVGTTLARDWDGATVAFECLPDYVDVGQRLRDDRADRAVRRVPRSCPGTWSGPPSGRSSA